jgi:hypothetical protein
MDSLFHREERVNEIANPPPRSEKPGAQPAFSIRWVPIRSLAARHRPRILSHILALSEIDRYLRFGYAASDVQIARYVEQLDFERDEVFGIFNRRLELLAMAHLAYLDPAASPRPAAEFADEPKQKRHGQKPLGKSKHQCRSPREPQAAAIGRSADSFIARQ